LAAPQIGRSERLTVVDVEGQRFVLINPEIVESSGKSKSEEGCLSIPNIYGDVQRPSEVVVRARGENWELQEFPAADLLARCIQHEVDHLHGKLFIDYLSVLKRRSALGKWEKEKENYPGLIRKITPGANTTRRSGSRTRVAHPEEEM
jgi:peptide deformylase